MRHLSQTEVIGVELSGKLNGVIIMQFRSFLLGAATAVVASSLLAGSAGAVVITNGDFSVGIGANGELYDSDAGVGFRRDGDGFDATAGSGRPDAWSANGAYAAPFQDPVGVSTTVNSTAPATATLTTLTDGGLKVVQSYSFVGSNIVSIDTTVTNMGDDPLSVLFGRNVDFNLGLTPDGFFEEHVFAPGVGGQISETSYFGGEPVDAASPYFGFYSCSVGCDALGDLGAGIKLNLGSLGSLQSTHFTYFYGLNQTGQAVGNLVDQTKAAGASYVIAGESVDGSGNAFTFGVGGLAAVPEPATWAMMIVGFFGLGAALRRRRAADAFAA